MRPTPDDRTASPAPTGATPAPRADATPLPDTSLGIGRRVAALVRRVAAFWAMQSELHERRDLLNRPWEERYQHWVSVDGEWVLHGDLIPPRGSAPTTLGGWCPAAGRRDPSS